MCGALEVPGLVKASTPAKEAGMEHPAPSAPASPFAKPSPFESDRSRKSEATSSAAPMPMASVRPEPASSVGASSTYGAQSAVATAVAVEPEPQPVTSSVSELSMEALREGVLSALENAGQQVLAHNLEQGEWSLRGAEVCVRVAMSQTMVDFALGDGPKRIVHEALTKATGRSMKFKMVSGGAQFTPKAAPPSTRPANCAGARSRAMADPVVQRMQEKFGAEIRSVIDHKERG